VTFDTPVATDDVDITVIVTYTRVLDEATVPPSGSVFALGPPSLVACSPQDSSENTGAITFYVTVATCCTHTHRHTPCLQVWL
jgi:hypothetical protein